MAELLHIWVLRVLVLQQVQATMQQGLLRTLVPFFSGVVQAFKLVTNTAKHASRSRISAWRQWPLAGCNYSNSDFGADTFHTMYISTAFTRFSSYNSTISQVLVRRVRVCFKSLTKHIRVVNR